MNKYILMSVLSILSMAWPLSVVQARCGLGRNIGLGGNIQPFEVPAVNEWVSVNGFTLKVNRVKWSIQTAPTKPITALFRDDSTAIRALRLPHLRPDQSLRDLALASASSPGQNIRLENIRTAFEVRGVKASYGGTPNLLSQNPQLVRYYFQGRHGEVTCFEVSATKKFADWSESNNLILNTLSHERSG